MLRAFNNSKYISVIPISAIYDYKKYYDTYIDPKLKILKEEATQHGWRIERLSLEEERNYPILNAGVKTNYTKAAQAVSFDLRRVNPLHDPDAESDAYIYSPVVRISSWLPQDAKDNRECKPGMSFLCKMPVGMPEPMAFTKRWYDDHIDFLMHIKGHFDKMTAEHANIINNWKLFTANNLPPTQSIKDYVAKMGSKFPPPLSEYIYGSNPKGFFHLRKSNQITSPITSRLFCTSFVGENAKRASVVDRALQNVVYQIHESVEWRGNIEPLKAWKFDAPEMMSKVIVNVKEKIMRTLDQQREYLPVKRTYKFVDCEREGTIVAFCRGDINDGDVFQVRY